MDLYIKPIPIKIYRKWLGNGWGVSNLLKHDIKPLFQLWSANLKMLSTFGASVPSKSNKYIHFDFDFFGYAFRVHLGSVGVLLKQFWCPFGVQLGSETVRQNL